MSDRFERALAVASHTRAADRLGVPERCAVVASWHAEVAEIVCDYLDPTTETASAEAEWKIATSFHRMADILDK
jgi:hypothetical protein